MKIYDVPGAEREAVIDRVMAMNLAAMARGIVEKTVQKAHEGFDISTLRASTDKDQEMDTL